MKEKREKFMKNKIVIVTVLTSCSLNGGIVRPVNTKQDGH